MIKKVFQYLPLVSIFVCAEDKYSSISLDSLSKVKVETVEIYSEKTRFTLNFDKRNDSLSMGTELFHYDVEPKVFKRKPKIVHGDNMSCAYACMLDRGSLVINKKYLIFIPCGGDKPPGDLLLIQYSKNDSCLKYSYPVFVNEIKNEENVTLDPEARKEYLSILNK